MSLDARYWDREFETRPWAWIEAWQAQQLAMMLETLPQRSELYREVLAAAGQRVGLRGYWVGRGRLPTLDMLDTVPFTTGEQLRLAQDLAPPGRPLGLQQAVPQQYIVQVVAAPTDGVGPVFYGLTRRDQEVWSDAIANSLWTAGIRPDDVVALLADQPAVAAGWPYADGLRRLGATVAWLGGWSPDQVLARLPALQVTWLACCVGAACCLPAVPQLVADISGAGAGPLAGLLYLGLAPTSLAFSTWAYALARMDAGRLGISTYLVPPLTVLGAWPLLAEVPPPLALAGGVLCLAGVALSRRR